MLILQPFRHFTYVTTHSPNPSVASPTPQLILQPFRYFTYVTAHSPTLSLLYLRHSSFSNPSVALPTSQLILQPFRRFTYATAHSPTLPLLYLRHSSFSNRSFASPTLQTLHLASRLCYHVIVLEGLFRSTEHSPSISSQGDPVNFSLMICSSRSLGESCFGAYA